MPTYTHLLLAVDFSKNTDEVIDKGLALAGAFEARVSLVHVVEFAQVDLSNELVMPQELELDQELLALAETRQAARTRRQGVLRAPGKHQARNTQSCRTRGCRPDSYWQSRTLGHPAVTRIDCQCRAARCALRRAGRACERLIYQRFCRNRKTSVSPATGPISPLPARRLCCTESGKDEEH